METAKKNIKIENQASVISKPSTEKEEYFIRAYHGGVYPEPTEKSGKWLLFIDKNEIDNWWVKIVFAFHAGQLGNRAKVSTARPNPNSRDPSKHVICIYSYDSSDVDDVYRIRQVLRGLGVIWKIAYKTDASTREGNYRARGHTNVSKYWE